MYMYTAPTVNVFTGRIPFFDQLQGLFITTASFFEGPVICYKHCLECTVDPRLSGFLDYPDFFSGPNLLMNIYMSQSRSVAISFFKLQHWKVEWNARFCVCFQTAKAALAPVVTNEEHSMSSEIIIRYYIWLLQQNDTKMSVLTSLNCRQPFVSHAIQFRGRGWRRVK